VAALAEVSLFGLDVRVRDVAAVLFPAVASGLFAHGVRASEGRAPSWLQPEHTGAPARFLGGAGVVLFSLLFCRPAAWGFAGEVAGGGISFADLAASLALSALYGACALASVPRWLRRPGYRAGALAALFPLAVLPGLAIVHCGGSGRLAATWMLVYTLALAGMIWREGARRDQIWWVGAARAFALLAIAARFLDLPLR
jgi:hypothetical protein